MKITIEIDAETYEAFKILADFSKITVEAFISEDLRKSIAILNPMGLAAFIEALKLLKLQQKNQDYTR
jgi:hypothetical protein